MVRPTRNTIYLKQLNILRHILQLASITTVCNLLFLTGCQTAQSIDADTTDSSEDISFAVSTHALKVTQESPTLGPENPAFIAYSTQRLLSFSVPNASPGLGLIPSPLDMSHNTISRLPQLGLMSDTPLPPQYDLRQTGGISSVKSQGSCGACWTFATFASMESFLLPDERDFSEQHLKNNHGLAVGPCDGGHVWMSQAYLSRWMGPHFESDDPYLPDSTITISSGIPRYHVQEMVLIPSKSAPLEHQHIKRALLEHGALYISMCWDQTAVGGAEGAYYYSTDPPQNGFCPPGTGHAVTLAGWDDTISASSFGDLPPGDGAYIIKNSWGPHFGDDGYFYASYYDGTLGYLSIAAFTADPVTQFDHQYGFDPYGVTGFFGWGLAYAGTTNLYAAVFTAEDDERLDAVATYTKYPETQLVIDVYKNPDASSPTNGDPVATHIQFTPTYPGYYTVPVSPTVSLSTGDTFSVVVSANSAADESGFLVPVEQYSSAYAPNAEAELGQTFISLDGSYFFDLATSSASANIKAFTTILDCTTDDQCDDGNLCNGSETCVDHRCKEGDALNCDNGLFCDGQESCDPTLGCITGQPIECNDDIDCTVDTCDENTQSCKYLPDHQRCNNGLFCDGQEQCIEATGCIAGTPIDCDDQVACTDDSCDDTVDSCQHTANHAACDNGQFCDGPEQCDPVAGCTLGTPVVCDDRIDCTKDDCDETLNQCTHSPNDMECNNGQFCDGRESCNPSTGCEAGTPIQCDDQINCTLDQCDETTDRCVNIPDHLVCDNGQYCDGIEQCDSAQGCVDGTPIHCNDQIDCTLDRCDETGDVCIHTPDNTSCDNGIYCDGEESCSQTLGCQPGRPLTCDDGISCTVDTCDIDSDTCSHVPDHTLCDNDQYCDGQEYCNTESGCEPGIHIDCNDNLPCTIDNCDEQADRCTHQGDHTPCDDGNPCTNDICSHTDGCIHENNFAPCDDGIFCNGTEQCQGGTCLQTAPPCDPISETCDETTGLCSRICNGCELDGVCFDEGAAHPTIPCMICDAAAQEWFLPDSTRCDSDNDSDSIYLVDTEPDTAQDTAMLDTSSEKDTETTGNDTTAVDTEFQNDTASGIHESETESTDSTVPVQIDTSTSTTIDGGFEYPTTTVSDDPVSSTDSASPSPSLEDSDTLPFRIPENLEEPTIELPSLGCGCTTAGVPSNHSSLLIALLSI